ncbi:unnamed protein product [Lasius platythorax]|uniref:Uncharacterized protein n=1 Tax=Lasius platythorax TaxID=488582 RepID=A0AAV2P959_9HYME
MNVLSIEALIQKEKHSPLLDIAAAPTNCMARTAPTRRNLPEPPRFAATDPLSTPNDPFDVRRPPGALVLVRGLHLRDPRPSSQPPQSGRSIDVVLVTAITDRFENPPFRIGECSGGGDVTPNYSEADDATEKSGTRHFFAAIS